MFASQTWYPAQKIRRQSNGARVKSDSEPILECGRANRRGLIVFCAGKFLLAQRFWDAQSRGFGFAIRTDRQLVCRNITGLDGVIDRIRNQRQVGGKLPPEL